MHCGRGKAVARRGNPLISNADPNARRIIAYGLRNPFRQTLIARPGTDEIWVGDVGSNTWEEIDRIANPTDSIVENFGWPCYEGSGRRAIFDDANLNICENLYGQANADTTPRFAYNHSAKVVPGESCSTGTSSISGLAFYKGGPYPDEYDDALFFADYSRNCIWVMEVGTNGLPNPGQLRTFVDGAAGPVDLQIGPNGDLFYVDLNGGKVWRVQYASANQPPVAHATANPTNGGVPLTVSFDGSGSSDSEGGTLTYKWDLDGDGAYDDSTAANPTYTYDTAGDYQVGLRVTDGQGASDTLDQRLTISAGNTAPTATIDSPSSTTTWKVGDTISFSGSATDQQEESPLAASSLTWSLIMHHCSSEDSCHEHVVEEFAGVASGSFVAPDHEYPSYLELQLAATDSGRLTDTKSVRLDPKTVKLSFLSVPAELQLTVGGASETTPFSRTVIVGSKNSISAPSPQTLGVTTYEFASWSDGGVRSHDIVAPDAAATYTATYAPSPDSTPPETTIVSGPTGNVKSTSASFSFSSEAGSTFQCRRDGSNFSACTSPKSYSNLSQGNQTFRVRAIDKAGNIDATPASRSWFVDTVVPNGTISINGGASTSSRSVRLSLSASDPPPASGVASMRFRNEGTTTWSSWFDYSTSKSWTLSAGAGTKTVYVKYRDHAGNTSAAASDTIRFRP